MKYLPLCCLLLFVACDADDAVKSFIPGVYVRHIDHEYGTGSDTLTLTKLNDNTYEMHRSVGFSRINDSTTGAVENKSEIWTAIYNKEEHVLNETKKGKVISFIPGKNMLLVSTSAYRKIKK